MAFPVGWFFYSRMADVVEGVSDQRCPHWQGVVEEVTGDGDLVVTTFSWLDGSDYSSEVIAKKEVRRLIWFKDHERFLGYYEAHRCNNPHCFGSKWGTP